MPRDSGGTASLDPGYRAVTGQTIQASQHNPPLEDIVSMLTDSLDRSGRGSMLANLNFGTFKGVNLGDGTNAGDAVNKGQLDSLLPVGSVIDFAGTTAPTGWLLCYGQAISRSEYAALFAAIGTTWGVGDGTTTFNVPDCRGRVRAGRDNMGGTDAERLSDFWGVDARTLGESFGTASHELATAELAQHSHSVTGTAASAGTHAHTVTASGTTASAGDHNHQIALNNVGSVQPVAAANSGASPTAVQNTSTNGAHTHSVSVSGGTSNAGAHTHNVTGTAANTGSGDAHTNTQPTIIFNTIIRAR